MEVVARCSQAGYRPAEAELRCDDQATPPGGLEVRVVGVQPYRGPGRREGQDDLCSPMEMAPIMGGIGSTLAPQSHNGLGATATTFTQQGIGARLVARAQQG